MRVLLTNHSAISGREIASRLGVRSSFNLRRSVDVLIRYGSCRAVPPAKIEINSRQSIALCVNKLKSLKVMAAAGVPTPKIFTRENVVLPVFARKKSHYGGRDIVVCRTEDDLQAAMEAGCEFFTEFIPKDREYRIHVFDGEVIHTNIKSPRRDGEHSNIIRNYKNGWRFRAVDPEKDPNWQEILDTAVAAVKALGLTFGGVDIARTKDGRAVVFEVNSGPGLSSVTFDKYAQAITKYIRKVK